MRKTYLVTVLLVIVSLSMVTWQWMKPLEGTVQERKRIAFDETHAEVHRIIDTYNAFSAFLVSSGFDVEAIIEGPLTLDKLRRFSAVVIPLPTKLFSANEIEAVKIFVKGGGGLLIIGDSGGDLLWGTNINNVSKSFGVEFNQDVIRVSQEPAKIRNFKPHPVTTGVTEISYYSGSSLNVYGDATALAFGGEDVWADRYVGKMGVLEVEESKGSRAVVVAASEYGLGRVVCLGSSTLFLEPNLLPDHKKIGYNILRWLSSVEPVVTYVQNAFIKVKFLDDDFHSSYQIDVWDASLKNWTTAYHDVRFYTTNDDGFNFTWNIGGASAETRSLNGYRLLVVRYPEVKPYLYEKKVVDVGSSGDESHVVGNGWSDASKIDNKTVRRAMVDMNEVYVLLDYPNYPWLQYSLNIIYADIGKGRVDINVLTTDGWTTLNSFYREGNDGWKMLNLRLNLTELYVESGINRLRIGIHAEENDLVVDEVSLSNSVQSGAIEVTAAVKDNAPIIYFYVRNLGDFQLSKIGIIGELSTKFTQGNRFALSTLMRDAYLESGHEVRPSQGLSQRELKLGSGEDLLSAPSYMTDFHIYGEGWSESFLVNKSTAARAVLANRTNTFLVVPMPPTLNVLYNLSVSYFDVGTAPFDVHVFNGSQWVAIGDIKRENTGAWKTAVLSVPPSEMYLDTTAGGVKIGFFAYENNFMISKIAVTMRIIGEDGMAVAFSGEKVDTVNFMVVPKADGRLIQHEVDGSRDVIKTIDISMSVTLLGENEVLPVAAVGAFITDTSGLLKEVENVPAEGWRPNPTDLSPPLVSGNLAVARMNGSSLSYYVDAPITGKYRVVVRYYDLPEGYDDKEVVVYIDGREVGRIRYEDSSSYLFWTTDIELVKGANVVTLTPLSKVSTSEIAYIDYVIMVPQFWEEQATYELVYAIPELLWGN